VFLVQSFGLFRIFPSELRVVFKNTQFEKSSEFAMYIIFCKMFTKDKTNVV